jgi:hypothetical protein
VDFYERFELLNLLRDSGIKTFEGREIATAKLVHIHLLLAPKAPIQAALLKAIDRLPENEARRIIHRGKNEGTLYFVTECLTGYTSLEDWVLRNALQPQPSAPPNPAHIEHTPKPAWKHN